MENCLRSGYSSGKESCDDMHFGKEKPMLVSGSPSITQQKHHPAARMDRTHRWQVAIDEANPPETT